MELVLGADKAILAKELRDCIKYRHEFMRN
jgi:hypothetical protein